MSMAEDMRDLRLELLAREQRVQSVIRSAMRRVLQRWKREILLYKTDKITARALAGLLRQLGMLTRAELIKIENWIGVEVERTTAYEFFRVQRIVEKNLLGKDASLVVKFGKADLQGVYESLGVRPFGFGTAKTFANITARALDSAQRELASAVSKGQDYQWLTRQWLKRSIGARVTEVESEALTAVLQASNRAHLATYRLINEYGDRRVITRLRWDATFDARTCIACGSRHGQEYPVDNPPLCPLHYRCLLKGTKVTRGSVVGMTRARYQGPYVEIRTRSGCRLRVTQQHPILTRRGFVAAIEIVQGDEVARDISGRKFATLAPHDDNLPVVVEEAFDAARQSCGMQTTRVPVATEDFHGDARYFNGGVDVVSAYGFLRRDTQPGVGQLCDQQAFIGSGASGLVSLLPSRNVDQELLRFGLAADAIVGGLSESEAVFYGHALHADFVGLAAGSERDSASMQCVCNGRSGQPDSLRDREHGMSFFEHLHNEIFVALDSVWPRTRTGNIDAKAVQFQSDILSVAPDLGSDLSTTQAAFVEFDPVVSVVHGQYSGYVYDFQTKERCYAADGIISHNCRCILNPVFVGALADAEFVAPYRAKNGDVRLRKSKDDFGQYLRRAPQWVKRSVLGTEAKTKLFESGVPLSKLVTRSGRIRRDKELVGLKP